MYVPPFRCHLSLLQGSVSKGPFTEEPLSLPPFSLSHSLSLSPFSRQRSPGNLREAHPDGHLEARRCIISRSSSLSRVARILRSSLQPVACAACACRSRRASTASQPASNGDHAGNVRAASTWLLLRAFLDKTLRRCDVTGILDREAFFSARKYPPPNNTR